MATETRAARPIVIGVCPRCAGLGSIPYDGNWETTADLVTCDRCEGCGDLDAYRLTGVWLMGYEAAMGNVRLALRAALDCLETGVEQNEQAPTVPPASVIRARLGG